MLRPLTKEEIRWTQAQPVIGSPSLTRLRARLEKAGYPPIRIALVFEGDVIMRGRAAGNGAMNQGPRRIAAAHGSPYVGFTELGRMRSRDWRVMREG